MECNGDSLSVAVTPKVLKCLRASVKNDFLGGN